jgi:hypothetical protein
MSAYLLSYDMSGRPGYHTRGFMYELTLEKIYFFGMFRRMVKTSVIVEGSLLAVETTWDEMIANRTPVKL